MKTSKLHLSLNVRDAAVSTSWYEAFFGMPPHKTRPGYANFDVASPAVKLALMEAPALAGSGGLNHLGVLVESVEEVEAARTRLKSAGFETQDESDVVCCHATQEKVWVKDPDGNAWEVYTILDDAPSSPSEKEGVCCAPGCCAS